MKKYILLAFKIIPLLTIIQGLLSGGQRMGPFVEALKVALTQYEVAQILKVIAANPNVITKPDKFQGFLQEKFHNQYSVLVRELKGDKSLDLSKDIWGKPFHLLVLINEDKVKMGSNGPDGTVDTKDDVAALITVDLSSLKKKKEIKIEATPVEEDQQFDQSELAQNHQSDHREPANDEEPSQDQFAQEGASEQQYGAGEESQEPREGQDENYDQRPHDGHSEEGAPESEGQEI